MSKGKLWGIILLILFVLGFGIWLYTSSDVKKDVDQEGIGVLDDMTINPEKPYVPLNKNDAFQKVQKRRVQKKR